MKNTYIAVLVLVLVVGIGFFAIKNNKLEAPIVEENNTLNTEESATNTEESSIPVNENISTNTEVGINIGGQEVKEFIVTGKNFSFSPSTITVNKGDKVKITFVNSEGFHNFKIDEFGVITKQIKSGASETIEFTADKAGSFEYYCSVGSHRVMGMRGTLTVN